MTSNGVRTALNGGGVGAQLRPFGGVEITPLPHAQIMAELVWAPRFEYATSGQTGGIALNATLTWGVRYVVGGWLVLEAGARIPEVQTANLLNAQIFTQVSFASRKLRSVMGLE
jgi:hypothetical protein